MEDNIKKLLDESSTENQASKNLERVEDKIKDLSISTETHSDWYIERVKLVALDLMSGLRPSQIGRKYADQWQLSDATIRQHYVDSARKLLAEELFTEENDIRIDLLAKYNYLFQINMSNRDYKEARAVLDSITKLTQTITSTLTVLGNLQTIQLVEVIRDEMKEGLDGIED